MATLGEIRANELLSCLINDPLMFTAPGYPKEAADKIVALAEQIQDERRTAKRKADAAKMD